MNLINTNNNKKNNKRVVVSPSQYCIHAYIESTPWDLSEMCFELKQ